MNTASLVDLDIDIEGGKSKRWEREKRVELVVKWPGVTSRLFQASVVVATV